MLQYGTVIIMSQPRPRWNVQMKGSTPREVKSLFQPRTLQHRRWQASKLCDISQRHTGHAVKNFQCFTALAAFELLYSAFLQHRDYGILLKTMYLDAFPRCSQFPERPVKDRSVARNCRLSIRRPSGLDREVSLADSFVNS